ncbi:unnamed protein product [Linum tenue]|uniref:Uncharacterized protein n=1 Tax=Linum tenue TaxID=586396 RepID=A0AAV0PGB8_9ROSI|nr:unnamed protein product [Linum tenue]
MAAAEARAAWQRAANRCFVQEDAKRAPKLACCHSSSSKLSEGEGPTGAAEAPDSPASGFMPFNRNPSYSSLPHDTRWWLQLQPCYGYQKGLTFDQLNALEAEVESLRSGVGTTTDSIMAQEVVSSLDHNSDSTWIDVKKSCESSLDAAYSKISADCFVYVFEGEDQVNGLNASKERSSQSVEADPLVAFHEIAKSNVNSFDPESPWSTVSAKSVPWWRTADKDNLASLVAQKSLDYMENCDLPPPRKFQIDGFPCADPRSSNHDGSASHLLDWRKPSRCVSDPIVHIAGPTEIAVGGGQLASTGEHSQSGYDNTFSPTTTLKDVSQDPESDPCKAWLLEALRHSQTRAREAEKAAKQACADKEHVIMLFLKQASQLLSYKQWFQLLQLETLYHQLKNSEDPMATLLFPVALPWMPPMGKKLGKNRSKTTKGSYKRGKRNRARQDMKRYAVAFALGLSLVGTGLLLGWTVGWMLPF